MIKSDELYEVTIVGTNLEHYRKFYPDIKLMDKIQVKGTELPRSSHVKVKYICDYCGAIYERMKYSEIRSGEEKNACKKCRSLKSRDTCLRKYGVEHPMQVSDIHQRSVDNHIINFGKEYKDCDFFNGIPVSKAQKFICDSLENFQLNYKESGYFYDMFNIDLNIVIEYNGKGHDLQVRRGKITLEQFQEKEDIRKETILKKHRLLIIEDKKDKLRYKKYQPSIINQILNFIHSDKKYDIIYLE